MKTLSTGIIVSLIMILTAPAAFASCPEDPKTQVKVVCSADLMGMSAAAPTVTNETKSAALDMGVTGNAAVVTFGDYSLSGKLTCSGSSDGDMDWQFEVRLTQAGRPPASPLQLAMVRNLELQTRKSPLQVISYFFFEKPVPHPKGDKTFDATRLDYVCEVQLER